MRWDLHPTGNDCAAQKAIDVFGASVHWCKPSERPHTARPNRFHAKHQPVATDDREADVRWLGSCRQLP